MPIRTVGTSVSKISIRTRIVGLITVALSASLAAYLYIGTQLIVADKTSYIYDYNLADVRSVSAALQNQIGKVKCIGMFPLARFDTCGYTP